MHNKDRPASDIARSTTWRRGGRFIGGSWHRTTLPVNQTGSRPLTAPGEAAFFRARGGAARELYRLEDDGNAHYVLTQASHPCTTDGLPCAYCNSTQTHILNSSAPRSQSVTLDCELTYLIPARSLATVRCIRCGMVFVVKHALVQVT